MPEPVTRPESAGLASQLRAEACQGLHAVTALIPLRQCSPYLEPVAGLVPKDAADVSLLPAPAFSAVLGFEGMTK